MILEYDNKAHEIKLKDLKVSLRLSIKNKSSSSATSSTSSTNEGVKPKVLNVAGILPFTEKEFLTQLVSLAEKENDDGSRAEYTISEETADASKIRKVIFNDDLNVTKAEKLWAWNISFALKEVKSIAESKEARKKKPVVKKTPDNGEVVSSNTESSQSEAGNEEHGSLYRFAQYIDKALAPDEDNETA